MVVGVGIGDRELDRHLVEERRVGQHGTFRAEVVGGREDDPIAAGLEALTFEQRCRRASVGVEPDREQRFVGSAEACQRDGDTGRRTTVGRIEDMGRELADDEDLLLGLMGGGALSEARFDDAKCIGFLQRDDRDRASCLPRATWHRNCNASGARS